MNRLEEHYILEHRTILFLVTNDTNVTILSMLTFFTQHQVKDFMFFYQKRPFHLGKQFISR